MALTELDLLLRNSDNIGFKLIPHIEELALQYVFRKYVMAQRVSVFSDMSGWNVRKISEYLPSRRAQELAEDTAIPDTTLLRARKSVIEPKEIGDRYRVSDRRVTTDLENITADIVTALGKGIGDKVEVDLYDTALSTFRGGTLGTSSVDYSFDLMLSAATLFRARARDGQLFHVIHPFQALPIMQELIDYTGAQTSLPFRDSATTRLQNTNLREFDLPTFGNVNLVIGEFLPRKVIHKLAVYGTGGTFRLQIGNGSSLTENITAAITVSATPATTVTNIQTALNTVLAAATWYDGVGTYVVSGAANDDLTITPPTDLYLNDEDQLRVAVKYDEDANLSGGFIEANLQKSAYDLVTGLSNAPEDADGNDLGVALWERSAIAKSLMWQRGALVLDIRKPVTSFFELTMQGRTAEYSGSMVYGAGKWSPEQGMFIVTKANSPLAVA